MWPPSRTTQRVKGFAKRVLSQVGNLESLDAHLASLFERLRVNVVIDVGAHVGNYTRLLRSHGYKGHIVSFEPVTSNWEQLNTALAFDKHWTGYKLALGHKNTKQSINIARTSDLSSFLQPSKYGAAAFHDLINNVDKEVVKVARLDSILPRCLPPVDQPNVFLKVDTQGYDIQVVEGAGNYLRAIRGLQMELPVRGIYEGVPTFSESISVLESLGFSITIAHPVVRDTKLRVIEFDCVFVNDTPAPWPSG